MSSTILPLPLVATVVALGLAVAGTLSVMPKQPPRKYDACIADGMKPASADIRKVQGDCFKKFGLD